MGRTFRQQSAQGLPVRGVSALPGIPQILSMYIVQLEPANSGQQGDRIYRTVQPCRALALCADTQVVSGTWLSRVARVAAAHADVLVLCKVVEVDLLPLLRSRRERGLVTVFEINDDFTDIQPWNTTAGFYAQPENRSLVTQLARMCDAVQFSSHGLLAKFGDLHSRTLLLPNQLWDLPPLTQRAAQNSVTIGWGGSYGHREDLASAIPSLKAVLQARPEARLSIMGDRRLEALFAWVPRDRIVFTQAGSLAAYHSFLNSLDIGIAPLLDTPFNRGRSDVKHLEYAAHGVVAVCADLVPYHFNVRTWNNGVLFSSSQSLQDALLRLIDEPALRTQIAATAYAEVGLQRMQQSHASAQLEFYASLRSATSHAGQDHFLAEFSKLRPDDLVSTYRECEPTRAEQHLYNGLVCQSDPQQAFHDFSAACEADPHNYLAHLHLGRMTTGTTASRHFADALAEYPETASAHFLHALAYQSSGETELAERYFIATLDIAPEYAPAWMRLGALHEQCGRINEAREDYTKSLEVNPDYGVAALALATLLLRTADLERAMGILEQHQTACTSDHRYWILLGQLSLLRRDAQTASHAFAKAARLRPDIAAIAELQVRAKALGQHLH